MKERKKELFLMITIWNVPNISTVTALLYIPFRWGKYKWNWIRLYDERCSDVLFKLQDVIIANGLMLHSHNNNTEREPQPVRGHFPPIRRALSVSMFRGWPRWNWRGRQIGYIHISKLPLKHTVLGCLKCGLFCYSPCTTQLTGFTCLA